MRRITVDERRSRLAYRHRLAPGRRGGGPVDVAESLVALHATDPASVYLAIRARAEVTADEIDAALYDDRTLVRTLGMRRTMFTLPVEAAGIVHAACTRAIAVRERAALVRLLADTAEIAAEAGGDVDGWLRDLERATRTALDALGEATNTELTRAEPRLGRRVLLAAGKPYQAWQSISTRVLFLLAADGHLVRGRPRGSWTSSQNRWTPVRTWLPAGIAEWSPDDARVELVRRWLAAYGPGTVGDLKWWTGATVGEIKRALARLDTVDVDLDGVTGLILAADADSDSDDSAASVPAGELGARVPEPTADGSWIALLPALDPTPMGWADRGWYLGDHAPALFDRSGNVGPTVWCDGRIVGGWAQRADGTVRYRLLEDIGGAAGTAVAAEAARLADWMGGVRVTPRFRTPLEKELSGR
ncbi:MAG: hypothetical protein QOE03_1294 [Micromonosporaceae bacterium]|jgi:hypothetical protein|nr:hypothetical protein [Micromonosporaceae bacterium]